MLLGHELLEPCRLLLWCTKPEHDVELWAHTRLQARIEVLMAQPSMEGGELNGGCHRARREFAQMAFTHAGMPLRWEGKAGTLTETGVVASGELKGRTVIRVNAKYFRPAEVGMSSKSLTADPEPLPRAQIGSCTPETLEAPL